MILAEVPETPQRKRGVEGGGPVGCGCGLILGLATGILWFLDTGWPGIALAVMIAVLAGIAGWRLGDAFFEKPDWFHL